MAIPGIAICISRGRKEMTLYKWSQTASADATADGTINWAEGQSPSSVNDSARAMMAATAKYRDDIAGAIVTGGTSTAYTVTSYEIFDTLAHLHGQMIAFTPHTTNGATVTLNVDSLGAKPLRSAPSTELLAGVLIQGTPYVAVYNSSDGAFYLRGFFGNPYNVPLLGGMDYWDTLAPNSSFIFPAGQAISRTTYAAAFARWGTTFGAGDGSTTFNVPDKTGRVSAMKEASAARLTSTYFGGNSTALGAVGGLESHSLTTAQLAVHSHANSLTDPGHTHHTTSSLSSVTGPAGSLFQRYGVGDDGSGIMSTDGSGITINNANAGSGNAHNNVQPTIVCNYIIRVI
jgi:microcystin-dependent protein